MNDKGYNGWTNRATWNIALWINNDEDWYALSRDAENFADFRRLMRPLDETPDGAKFADGCVAELDEVIEENRRCGDVAFLDGVIEENRRFGGDVTTAPHSILGRSR